MNFPSGENAASISGRAGSERKGSAVPGLGCSGSVKSRGSVQMSGKLPFEGEKINRPSGANEVGRGFNNLSTSR